ncbi:poly-gamma-glutamate hydrolase family protein [Spiractinospora alimapuensis]|uniref:poly-gamma-glutamate hydrolase family protein n=1 Tax=Spiractinospora alimapuensis TaxID=2820884 RepID=UPI001F27F27D|nr:poly-gamma-glutamate hydrolase family protein [Spiractinospora alimapuensis]QVQ52296.1 poly-gamma-glutamate hydrolase family protein [Spiractinospora alimapuensis]QVQ52314.1 poly-gamma-glutamate hydrolase family protein [Spiractinospora alimapuensis]
MITRTATVATTAFLTFTLVPGVPATAGAEDTYANYAELAAHETEGVDYRRTTRAGGTDLAHIAIHGGRIEPPTTELADHAAQAGDHAFATFEGIKRSGNGVLHITATRFDEPMTLEVVAASDYTISWHGAAGDHPTTYVGGLDTELRDTVRAELRASGFDAPDSIPDGLAGEDPDNIANRNARGAGVQLEITHAQRATFLDDGSPTETFRDYTAAVERAAAQR